MKPLERLTHRVSPRAGIIVVAVMMVLHILVSIRPVIAGYVDCTQQT